MKLNEQIASLRKSRNLTQEELATAIGVTNQSVSKWESGQCCPDIQLLPILASHFSVSVDYLMGIDQAPVEPCPISTTTPMADPILTEALKLWAENGKLYTALLQRKLQISYSRAKEILEKLEALGYRTQEPGGYIEKPLTVSAILPLLTNTMAALPENERYPFLSKLACAMHAAFFYQMQKRTDFADATDASLQGNWGYSSFTEPNITTVMRGRSVFYSDNQALDLDPDRIRRISALLRIMGDPKKLTVFNALYLCIDANEKKFASPEQIAACCKQTEECVKECLTGYLSPYVYEKDASYTIRGEAMSILPILSILCY